MSLAINTNKNTWNNLFERHFKIWFLLLGNFSLLTCLSLENAVKRNFTFSIECCQAYKTDWVAFGLYYTVYTLLYDINLCILYTSHFELSKIHNKNSWKQTNLQLMHFHRSPKQTKCLINWVQVFLCKFKKKFSVENVKTLLCRNVL